MINARLRRSINNMAGYIVLNIIGAPGNLDDLNVNSKNDSITFLHVLF